MTFFFSIQFSQRSPSPSHVSYNVDGEVMSEGGGEAEYTDDPASHNADIGAGPSGEASTSMTSSHTSKGKRRKVVGEETHELLANVIISYFRHAFPIKWNDHIAVNSKIRKKKS